MQASEDGARPATIPLRWDSHGIDVCVVLDSAGVSFVARDILEALGFDADTLQASPAHPWAEDGAAATLRDHAAGARWNRQQVADVLRPMGDDPLTSAFLAWLNDQVAEVNTIGVDHLARIALEGPLPAAAKPTPPVADAVVEQEAEHYSVLAAAQILDRDPNITIGRDSLFEQLHKWGWVGKVEDVWRPNRDQVFIGYLTTVDARVPGRHDLYPQVCITPLGIRAIHRLLGGVAELTFNRQHLTLIGDPR